MSKNNRARRKQKVTRKAAQKKRRRARSKVRGQEQTLAPTFHVSPNPFEGLSDDQRRLAIEEIAKNSDEKYQEALSNLRAILRRHNPLLVLSHMSCYGLSVGVGETTGITKLDSDFEIFPFHVEILQALSLQIEPRELSGDPFGPDVHMQVWNNVKTLCDMHYFRRLSPARIDLPDDEKTVAHAQERIRGATQAVRNWGYHSQVKRIARELYRPFNAELLEARGFSASDIFDVFESMVSEVEFRQTAHVKALAGVFGSSGTDRHRLVENYHTLIGLGKEEAERFVEHVNVEETPLDGIRAMVIAHYSLRLPHVYTFTAAELAESLGLDEDRVSAILDEYALGWGALNGYETEHLYLSNPVWEKLLVNLGDGEYFCVLPANFFSFVIPCMEAVLSPFAATVSDRRAEYLESKVAEIVERQFPTSNTLRNFKWVEDGKTYETDLIVFIDSFALVIECKSGKVTPPALRGAPDRLRKHIQELLIDPNLQSSRLKTRIEFLSSNPTAKDPFRQEIGYDLSKVRKVVRVSVCLEDFGTMQSSLKQLEDTGWLPTDFVPCPTMNLADFETVFDVLEHPVQILHYLMKREAVETSVGYLADELDLLGLYLTTLLDIGDVEREVELSLAGMSARLDAYYNSLDAGVTLAKPQPAISPLFASIFSQLEQRNPAGWTEIGVALNMFSPDDQNRITKRLAKLEKRVHRSWRTPGHENMLILIPSKASSYALAYVMFKDGNAGERRHFMEHAAATALQTDHVLTVVVIGKNIDGDDRVRRSTPHRQILRYLLTADNASNGHIRWGILTNGAVWRLYDFRARPRATGFYEVDLQAVLRQGDDVSLRAFLLLSGDRRLRRRMEPLPPSSTTPLPRAGGMSSELRTTYRKSSSIMVFPNLVAALVAQGEGAAANAVALADVRQAALIFLYRLLFILYAEDRNLLPVNDSRYDDYGLRIRVRDDVCRADECKRCVFSGGDQLLQSSHHSLYPD